jgi:pyruvate dehydrogenase E2 component (dihydrolipoamide acetyltransferase)
VLVGYGPRTTEAKRRPRKGAAVPDSVATSVAQASVQSSFATVGVKSPEVPAHEAEPAIPPAVPEPDLSAVPVADAGSPLQVRALAKPPVRKLAKDRGIDLRAVTPTGPGGVITRADVEGHRPERVDDREQSAPLHTSRSPEREDVHIPVRGVRKMTAEAMVASAFTAPHVTEWITVDVTRTVKLVDRLRGHRDFRDVKVSPLLIVARAVCLALGKHPTLNATFDEAAQEIVLKGSVNSRCCRSHPSRAHRAQHRRCRSAVAARAGRRVLPPDGDCARGPHHAERHVRRTFTITNVGVFGVDAGTPISTLAKAASSRSVPSTGAPGSSASASGPGTSPRWRCPSTTASSTASKGRASWQTWQQCSRTPPTPCFSDAGTCESAPATWQQCPARGKHEGGRRRTVFGSAHPRIRRRDARRAPQRPPAPSSRRQGAG